MTVLVKMTTTEGDITITLLPEKAPKTVENFINYIDSKFYNDTIFHRVIDKFMIQGGGYEVGMKEKSTNASIENEAANGLKNDAYTIAMARTNEPHSATAQFFINVTDNHFLDFTAETIQGYGYCVFGKVTEGQETVDKIKSATTHTVGYDSDVPVDDIKILSVTKIEL